MMKRVILFEVFMIETPRAEVRPAEKVTPIRTRV